MMVEALGRPTQGFQLWADLDDASADLAKGVAGNHHQDLVRRPQAGGQVTGGCQSLGQGDARQVLTILPVAQQGLDLDWIVSPQGNHRAVARQLNRQRGAP